MKKIFCFLAMFMLFAASHLFAYGAATHRYLSREAVYVLEEKFGSQYGEIIERYYYVQDLMKGAEEEDEPWSLYTRSKNHFLRPIDSSGWYNESIEPGSKGSYANAYDWAIGNPDYSWEMALALYINEDLRYAFEYLGHVTHLIQDVTVPAHSHIDTHPPPEGDDYERYCKEMTESDAHFSAWDYPRLTIPSTTTSQPLLKLKELFFDAAWKSYNLNRFQAELSDGVWTGELSEMYSIEWDSQVSNWRIRGVGYLGQDWWECELDPGYYYVENTDTETQAPYRWKGEPNLVPLCRRFTEEMIPTAVAYTVAVYKLFFEAAWKMKQNRGSNFYVSINGSDRFGIGTKAMPYVTIQEAIDQSKSGNKIMVSAGQYVFNDKIYLWDGYRRIIGEGIGKTIITCQEQKEKIVYLAEEGGSLEGITFIQESGQQLSGIWALGSEKVVVKNCEFIGLNFAIYTMLESSLTVESCVFRSGNYAISLGASSSTPGYSKIRNSYFTGIFEHDVILIGPSDNAEITGNTFNVAYDFSNYTHCPQFAPRVINSYYYEGTINARGNWWLLPCDLPAEYLVRGDVDVSRPLSSPKSKFQKSMTLENQGDINADKKVGLDDFVLFANHYGASSGDGAWNSRCDFNGDGEISLSDFVLFVSNFGIEQFDEVAKMAESLGIDKLEAINLSGPSCVFSPSYPNPANSQVHLKFFVPTPELISLQIFNSLGQPVRLLVDEPQAPGWHQVVWDSRDDSGQLVSSGVYFCEFKAGDFQAVKSLTLIR